MYLTHIMCIHNFYLYSNTEIFNQCAARIFKHEAPAYSVRGTDLFSLRLPNKQMTTASKTVTFACEWIKIISIFLVRLAKMYILVNHRILVIILRVHEMKKVENCRSNIYTHTHTPHTLNLDCTNLVITHKIVQSLSGHTGQVSKFPAHFLVEEWGVQFIFSIIQYKSNQGIPASEKFYEKINISAFCCLHSAELCLGVGTGQGVLTLRVRSRNCQGNRISPWGQSWRTLMDGQLPCAKHCAGRCPASLVAPQQPSGV